MTFFNLSQHLITNPFIPLFLICHLLSDFHLQSQEMADGKEKDRAYLLRHLFHVAWPLIILALWQPVTWPSVLIIIFSHALLDGLKPFLKNRFNCSERLYFSLDQLAHLMISISLARQLSQAGEVLATHLGGWYQLPTTILFFLLITKPANIAFRIFFKRFQPNDVEKMDTIPGAGATIGLLERIVIGICIIFGQFASIGLVFTAKSIARYNKISESPAFAEYYLIGSLFSIISALLAAWICFI